MVRYATLEIHKEEFSFSAGHFTIFSATERESLHGHNYNVSVQFNFNLHENGLSFDYRHYKKKMLALCETIDRYLLLPNQSPHLKIEDDNNYWNVYFNQEKMSFLKKDVVILPLTNITIEELSHWFLQHLLDDEHQLQKHHIVEMTVKVFNGPGQSGGSSWRKSPIR